MIFEKGVLRRICELRKIDVTVDEENWIMTLVLWTTIDILLESSRSRKLHIMTGVVQKENT
jgi:hypothetical protein